MSPDRWLVVTVRPLGPIEEGRVPAALVSIGGRAVEERDGAWVTHLPPPPDPGAFLRRLPDLLRERAEADLEVEHRWQPHEDWASLWRRGLGVRRIGRIVVRPSWCPPPETAPDDVVIELDPGVAFGTAEHGTTRGCLRLLCDTVASGERVVDVGAGSGILSLAAAGLGAGPVLALESDPMAVEAARENVERSPAGGGIRVEQEEVTATGLLRRGPFDGALANLETPRLLPLVDALVAAVRPGGWLVLGGVLETEVADVRGRIGASGAREEDAVTDEGWWSVRLRRPAP